MEDKKEMAVEELRSLLNEVKEGQAKLEQERAAYNGQAPQRTEVVVRESLAKQFMKVRSDEGLKINSTGKDYYGSLVEKFRIAKPITGKASFLRGAYTGFQIPLISARPAVNASTTEGDTALTVDSQMAIGRKTITPSLYYAILGITYQTDKFSMVTDAEIEDAFAESFGETIELAAQSRNAGSSYPISGLLSKDTSVCASGNTVTAATASTVTWADIYGLADKVKGKVGNWQLVVPTSIISSLLATTTEDYNFCKEEFLRKGTIRGLDVVEISTAVSHTAGDVYATAIDLGKNYKVAVASDDVLMRTVYDKNSLNKYLQGAMGIAASVVLPSEVFQLVAHAWRGLTLTGLGKGGSDPAGIVADSGIGLEGGKFKVDTSVLTTDKPYAWLQVEPSGIEESDVDSWHWGLYANAESTTDLWGGAFSGATLFDCGSKLGLDSTDLVDGRVLKMWTVKDNTVKDTVSVTLEVH